MRLAMAVLLVISSTVRAGGPIFERWDAAFLGATRAGHVHTIVAPKPGDPGQIVGTIELRLQIKRFNDTVALGMDSGTIETTAGVVTGVFMRQYLGKTQQLEIQGAVDGNKLHLTRDKTRPLDPAPWTDRVIGVARQQRLFQDQMVQPGDQFSYLSFEPSINLVVTNRVFVKDYELVETIPGAGRRKLLRAELKPDRIKDFQPPLLTVWLDDNREQVRSETEVPGLGKLTLVRVTRDQALAATGAAANTLDAHRVVLLKERLPRPHEMASAVYRIRIRDNPDPASGFATDGRQKPGNAKGDVFDLFVERGIVGQAEKVGPEYLQSSYFINSGDAKVRELARRAVGSDTDPWKKALRIEKFVAGVMTPKAHELLATSDHVAKSLEGDCTEYAMLTAAMCRAEGIPSRTAIGLVYGEVRGRPAFVFHMWTEVWVRGLWMSLDSTLGRGGVGAAHLKVSDQSWHNESSMTPLLSTINLLGRLSIDVVRTD